MSEVIISCDAKSTSILNWALEREKALTTIASGKKILWFLDFGLFSNLKWPLENEGQFSCFCLALDHFKEKLWSEFHKFSLGIALYRGNACLSDSEINYLHALTREPAYLIFDQLPKDPLLKAKATDPELYGSLKPYFLCEGFQWKTEQKKAVGICMPHFSIHDTTLLEPYRKILDELEGKDFKLIPEDQLVMSWEGLDLLYVHPPAISPSGLRKIEGFIAAGGEVVAL